MPQELYDLTADLLGKPWVSDVHITVGEAVWVRTSGVLERTGDVPIDDATMRSFLSRLDDRLLADPEDAIKRAQSGRGDACSYRSGYDFGAELGGRRCRCNLSLANGGSLSMVIRHLNENVPEFATLGLPDHVLKQTENSTGLILVTGPTGSGKSTTLASLLNHVNQIQHKHILTVEDPVEYLLPRGRCKVTRKEIGRDALSFIAALRAAMRQDPDIIMVGEIRDVDTMRAALAAAETGHLVFATLHTTSAAKTVDRVSSFFPPEEKAWANSVFSTVFKCVISQALIPSADGNGRVLAHEVMSGSADVRNNIKEGKINLISNSLSQGGDHGHVLMNRCLANMVRDNRITKDAALAHAYDREGLKKDLQMVGARA